MSGKSVDGMLVLYHHEFYDSAPTVMEHIRAFARSATVPVWLVNTEEGFPPGLHDLQFTVVVIHYSLSGSWPYLTAANDETRRAFYEYVREAKDAFKIAFFQDEYHDCQERFRFVNECAIDCVYTLVDPEENPKVYGRFTPGAEVRHTLTGYVPADMVEKARRWSKPRSKRKIDVGYRGRPLPFYMGRGAQEKTFIADEFVRLASGRGLTLDIKTAEADRIYGVNWYRFIADCKAMLGVEAGVSVFDLDGAARRACDAVLAADPDASFETVFERALAPYEDRIFYRTISPRVLEAAAFRTCMVLFEGRYNDLIEPMVHYIPLKKDFSNLDDVLRMLEDDALVDRLTTRAYDDLIASGTHSYDAFLRGFDEYLQSVLKPTAPMDPAERRRVTRTLRRGRRRRLLRRRWRDFKVRVWNRLHEPFPGKELLKPYLKPIVIWLFVPGLRKRK